MRRHSNTIRRSGITLWLNLALVGVLLLLVFYYVVMANFVAAKNYEIGELRDEIDLLTEENVNLASEKLSLGGLPELIEFASINNLVEAENVLYIFENKGVAKR